MEGTKLAKVAEGIEWFGWLLDRNHSFLWIFAAYFAGTETGVIADFDSNSKPIFSPLVADENVMRRTIVIAERFFREVTGKTIIDEVKNT